jgi:predicted transcriptional regulator
MKGAGLEGDDIEEDLTSQKISEKINNIITEGLVNVEPKPTRIENLQENEEKKN